MNTQRRSTPKYLFALMLAVTLLWQPTGVHADGPRVAPLPVTTLSVPQLRLAYVEEVSNLQSSIDMLHTCGANVEAIARYAHHARNTLKLKYRALTPPEQLALIDTRNLERYGDTLGPTFDYLLNRGRSHEQIIESATRAGGADIFPQLSTDHPR